MPWTCDISLLLRHASGLLRHRFYHFCFLRLWCRFTTLNRTVACILIIHASVVGFPGVLHIVQMIDGPSVEGLERLLQRTAEPSYLVFH